LLAGRIDTVLRSEAKCEVRDYKTTKKVATKEETTEQLRIYVVGLKKVGRPVKDGSVVYLEGGKNIDWSLSYPKFFGLTIIL